MGAYSNPASRAEALARVADALLRALGSSQIILLLPTPTERVEQLLLSPAVVRRIGGARRRRLEVMLSAATVQTQAEAHGCDPPTLFDAALGILHGGKLLRIESVDWASFEDVPYLYRIIVTD